MVKHIASFWVSESSCLNSNKAQFCFSLRTPHGFNFISALDREQLSVWVNGMQPEVEHAFMDNGTEIRFSLPLTDTNNNCDQIVNNVESNFQMVKDKRSNSETTPMLQHEQVAVSPVSADLMMSKSSSSSLSLASPSTSTTVQPDCAIQVLSSGNKREGIVYNLVVAGRLVPECDELC